jgi:CBS domain-containing protein
MIGGALGGFESLLFPENGAGFWPLVSMGAVLAGTIQAPFTAIVFAVEITGGFNLLLPVTVGCFVAYGLVVLTMKRSILTEKIARRGYHLTREYSVDPLEMFLVKEAMRTKVTVLNAHASKAEIQVSLDNASSKTSQHLYPIVDDNLHLVGLVPGKVLRRWMAAVESESGSALGTIAVRNPVVAHSDEPLRTVVYRMVETGLTRFPVVDDENKLLGIVTLRDLLHARFKTLSEERDRERPLGFKLIYPWMGSRRRVSGLP